MAFSAIAAVALGSAAYSVSSSMKQSKEAKKAAEASRQQTQVAVQDVKDSQKISTDQGQAKISARRRSATQTVFTSPLGVTTQANTAKKVLLGQ